MATSKVCSECGTEIDAAAENALCTKCLLALGLPAPTGSLASTLQTNFAGASVANSPGVGDSLPAFGTPRSFADYELLEEIARGGMGIVHKAWQKSLNRIVAIKMLLHGTLSNQQTIQRFRIEAAAAASLQHPHIVAIHEVGFYDGQHFFAMEYVAGRSLAAIVKDGPLPPRRAAMYLKAIAEAMQYAHERGILHRDLKPSNVLIDPFDQPKVTDFGLAKRLDDTQLSTQFDHQLTLSGQLLGSPNYMPPEQAAARRGAVGKRSDVYSLGAILYHLLTGRPPFIAPTVAETLHEVLSTEPVSPRVLNPGVPPDLETLCLKCLEKEPAKRYQTAAALAEELGRFLNDEPIEARPVTRTERVQRWCRRKPVIAALAASLAIVFVAGLTGVLTQWRRATNNSEKSRQQVARLNVLSGVHLMQDGDYLRSLLWFTEALRTDAGRSEREQIHRARIASVLQECPRLVQVISHDGQRIANAAFSATDDRLATVSAEDRTVRVWEMPGGKLLAKSKKLGVVPYSVLFCPDGQRLLVVLSDNTARLLDAATGEPLGEPLPHIFGGAGNSALFPMFDSSGQRFVTQSKTNELQVRDARTGQALGKPMVHPNGIERMQFNADGSLLFTRSEGPRNFLWNASTGESIPFPVAGADAVGTFFAGTRTNLALIAGRIQSLKSSESRSSRGNEALTKFGVWDLEFGISSEPLVPDDYLRWASFSPDGARVATASRDRAARVWDALSGKPLTPPLPHEQAVSRVAFSPDGHRVLTVSDDNLTRVWDADTGEPLTPPIPYVGGASAFSGSGRYLLTVHPNYAACVWDLHHEYSPPALLKSGSSINETASRGGMMVSKEMNNLIRVRSLVGGKDVSLHPISMKTFPLQMWPDDTGRYILLEGEMGKIQIWDATARDAASVTSIMPITPQVQSRYAFNEADAKTVKLPTVEWPVDELATLAQLLSGSRLDGSGGWTNLELEDLTAAWERLTVGRVAPRAPELGVPPSGGSDRVNAELQTASAVPLTRWHRREATAAEGASDWWAAAFHWRKLSALQPGSPEITQRLDYSLNCLAAANVSKQSYREQRRRIPPRDPRADARQIDLTAHYTAPITDGFSDARRDTGLQAGLQKFGGVTFDVRGLVQLFGGEFELRGVRRPERIAGIQIRQRAARLHLLHSEQWAEADAKEGEEIAALTIHYANGQDEKLSIQNAVHVANDWSGSNSEAKQAQVAWIGTTALANVNQNSVRLYKYSWPNPHPDWEITQVDLASAKTKASYLLVAMTME